MLSFFDGFLTNLLYQENWDDDHRHFSNLQFFPDFLGRITTFFYYKYLSVLLYNVVIILQNAEFLVLKPES